MFISVIFNPLVVCHILKVCHAHINSHSVFFSLGVM